MPASFTFLIRPLSLEDGFELQCEGLLEKPFRFCRLIEAIIAAAQIGQGLAAEIQIFDSEGNIVEVLELSENRTKPAAGRVNPEPVKQEMGLAGRRPALTAQSIPEIQLLTEA